MSKGVMSALELVGAAVAAYFGQYQLAASLAGAALGTEMQARAEIKSRNAYNAGLRDRYAMIRSTVAARQLVFGRCRVSGPTFFATSYGTNNVNLVMCVALAAHEIDAVEAVYFNDQLVSLDGGGNVTGVRLHETFSIAAATATVTVSKTPYLGSVTASARYGTTVVPLTVTGVSGAAVSLSGATPGMTGQLDIYYQSNPDAFAPLNRQAHSETFTVVTGSDNFTLSQPADSTGVHVVYKATSSSSNDSTPVAVTSAVGYSVTISGATPGRQVVIYYETSTSSGLAKVRAYLGAPAQSADLAMRSELPGIWTRAHTASGVAYLVVECTYDQGAYAGGPPNVSAVIRGMKCYDPRSGVTQWTENPALHARALATHSLGGRLDASSIDDASVVAAANISDATTTYTVGGVDYARKLYTAGYAWICDQKPMDGITDLCQAMGGDKVYADGMLRLTAGAYRTPNPGVMDETWLTDEQAVQVQGGTARGSLVNAITSSIADQYQDFRVVPLDQIPTDTIASPNPYVGVDGAKLPQDIQYAAITFGGQAQYVSSCKLRRMRQGLTIVARCNWRAWQAERFDVINVSLDRFGWDSKPFEVMSDTLQADGSIELTLQETTAEIWDMDAGFTAVDIAPNTNMPSPWGLPQVTGLAALSDSTTALLQSDGTVVPRLLVTWNAITDSRVLVGGYVEIRYWRMGDSSDTFGTVKALGTDTRAYITGIQPGAGYMVIARTGSAVTQSPWSSQVNIGGAGRSLAPSDPTGLGYTQNNNRVHVTWNVSPDTDYLTTEVRYGSSWSAGTTIGQSAGTTIDWINPAQGSYTLWVAYKNRSGIYSATPQGLSVTVDASIYGNGIPSRINPPGNVYADSYTVSNTHVSTSSVKFSSTGFMAYRKGQSETSSLTESSRSWCLDQPPVSPGYKLRADIVNVTGGALTGPTGSFQTLDSSNSALYTLTITNGSCTAVLTYTIFDSTGVYQYASGTITLTCDSSN